MTVDGFATSPSSARTSSVGVVTTSCGERQRVEHDGGRDVVRHRAVLDRELVVLGEQASRGLGALEVAADPVEGLGEPAQHGGPAVGRDPCGSAAWTAAAGPPADAAARRRGTGAWWRATALTGVPGSPAAAAMRGSPSPAPLALVEDPGVLGAAALRGVHDEAALGQRDAGEAAGQHVDLVAVVDGERAQVDVARLDGAVLHHRRAGRERDDRLRDPRPRVGLDRRPRRRAAPRWPRCR